MDAEKSQAETPEPEANVERCFDVDDRKARRIAKEVGPGDALVRCSHEGKKKKSGCKTQELA
jgi:hypothetical protein